LNVEDNLNDHDGDTKIEKSNATALETPFDKQNNNATINNTAVRSKINQKLTMLSMKESLNHSVLHLRTNMLIIIMVMVQENL